LLKVSAPIMPIIQAAVSKYIILISFVVINSYIIYIGTNQPQTLTKRDKKKKFLIIVVSRYYQRGYVDGGGPRAGGCRRLDRV